jgi:type IV pilus assembly protein PilA
MKPTTLLSPAPPSQFSPACNSTLNNPNPLEGFIMKKKSAMPMKKKPMKQSGFSLIELLIVVAVILVISAIAIPAAIASSQAGNEASAVANMRATVTAEGAYEKLFPTLGYSAKASYLAMTGGASSCPNTPDPTGIGSCLLANNIANNLDAGTVAVSGFLFTYAAGAGGTGYTMTAVPSSAVRGRKSYCVDNSGSIVYSWGMTAPAPASGVCPPATTAGPVFALGS